MCVKGGQACVSRCVSAGEVRAEQEQFPPLAMNHTDDKDN